ncbi:MAG: hypothetical protein JRJ54_02240 [Deltaproteobacteria bacterium]|nr:hypothetical protein [Deltaproteobacteria bacterium]
MTEAPKKSTLSSGRRPQALADVSRPLLRHPPSMQSLCAKKGRFRFKNKLLSPDSITIALCLFIFPWAEFRRTKGPVKLHLLLDHDGYFPTYGYISNGKKHDVTVARKVPIPSGSIYHHCCPILSNTRFQCLVLNSTADWREPNFPEHDLGSITY